MITKPRLAKIMKHGNRIHKGSGTLLTEGGKNIRKMTIYALNEGRVYSYEYTAEEEKFSEYLPAVRKVLDSIEFIPMPSPPPEKIPSFMR